MKYKKGDIVHFKEPDSGDVCVGRIAYIDTTQRYCGIRPINWQTASTNVYVGDIIKKSHNEKDMKRAVKALEEM